MTRIDRTDLSGSADTLARAAALLDAVARDSDHAVEAGVPLWCGCAAGQLHAALGFNPVRLPFVGNTVHDIAAAVTEALTLLSALPEHDLTDPVLDAILNIRAAAAALASPAVP